MDKCDGKYESLQIPKILWVGRVHFSISCVTIGDLGKKIESMYVQRKWVDFFQ